MKNYSAVSSPRLADSQLKFRLELARKRLESYPLDDVNFLMMDLERPFHRRRHADFCTCDLTGRTLLFYVLTEGITDTPIPRLKELYERSMNNRRADDSFGPHTSEYPTHFISALANYYARYHDTRALDAAEALAHHWMDNGTFAENFYPEQPNALACWAVDSLSELYRETRDETYLNYIRHMVKDHIGIMQNAHSHGYLTTLRGLLRAAICAKDEDLMALVTARRQELLDANAVLPGGDISESFPFSDRNEGCSIADWIILNLMYGHATDDEEAYALAEHALWNALYFNQVITGGFGHRYLANRGYLSYLREAWWCCTANAGMCLAEVARHAVTVRNGRLKVNFLIPGAYTIPSPNRNIRVSISTAYPTAATTRIRVEGPIEAADVRTPAGVRGMTIQRVDTPLGFDLYVDGHMGYYTEAEGDGYLLKYGPMALAPISYMWNMTVTTPETGTTIPVGYTGESLSGDGIALDLGTPDADGFYTLSKEPALVWLNFEEGPTARLPGGEVAAHVPMRMADGSTRTLYLQPLCIATSNLTINDVPIVFDKV